MPDSSHPLPASNAGDPRAAAEELRRVLVESARRKSLSGEGARRQLSEGSGLATAFDVLTLNTALDRLAAVSPRRAELVKLRYFVGLTISEAAKTLGVSLSIAEADWMYAKAWLKREMGKS